MCSEHLLLDWGMEKLHSQGWNPMDLRCVLWIGAVIMTQKYVLQPPRVKDRRDFFLGNGVEPH